MRHKISVPDRDMTLLLITEELKSRKFFNGLLKLGLDYTPFRPHLDALILAGLGLDAEENAVLDFYEHTMNTHADALDEKPEAIACKARKAYDMLSAGALS